MPSVQLGPPRDVKVAKVGKTHIELTWLAPVGGVTGYRVSGRCGGEGFFVALIEDTNDPVCGARVPAKPGCWWELRVAAIAEGMAGAESKLTQPVMTKGGESRRQAQGGDKPGWRGSRRRRVDRRQTRLATRSAGAGDLAGRRARADHRFSGEAADRRRVGLQPVLLHRPQASARGTPAKVGSKNRNLTYYTTQSGDTLWDISKAKGVSIDSLKSSL